MDCAAEANIGTSAFGMVDKANIARLSLMYKYNGWVFIHERLWRPHPNISRTSTDRSPLQHSCTSNTASALDSARRFTRAHHTSGVLIDRTTARIPAPSLASQTYHTAPICAITSTHITSRARPMYPCTRTYALEMSRKMLPE